MHLSKSAILTIFGFSAVALANIYPDRDPCNPLPPLPGEYTSEYETRMDIDYERCACYPTPPARGETFAEFKERNEIDIVRCTYRSFLPLVWIDPGPIIVLGPLKGPVWVGGPSWRDPALWRDGRWGRPTLPPPGWRSGERPYRGGPRRGPEPHREPPRGPEPHREPPRPEPHREPPRPEPYRGGPEPHRGGPEPHRGGPEPHRGGSEPHRGGPEPHRGGRP